MGIRRRKSTLLLMTITALLLIYIYFALDAASSTPASSSSYAGRSQGKDYAANPQPDLNNDVLRLWNGKQDRENEEGERGAVEDRVEEGELERENERQDLLDAEAEDRELEGEDETDAEQLRRLERRIGAEREREETEEGEGGGNAGEEGKGDGPDDESRQIRDESYSRVEGDGAKQGRPYVERMVQRESPADDQSSHVTRLIVLAYMRTGSSMTGRFLRFSPDVFYVYEPLHTLERYYVTGGHIDSPYRNTTLNEWFKASDMAAGNTSAILSCDIAHVYSGILLDSFMALGDENNHAFHRCFSSAASLPDLDGRARLWQQCETNMTRVCNKVYKATAVKTIRLTMARALEIMRSDPKVKVLHLTRDPRGVLVSRKNIGYANFAELKDEASLLCGKIQEDLEQVFDPMARGFVEELKLRSRYWLVRYEDIARAPLDFTQQLYNFMGIGLTEQVLQSVKKMMDSAKRRKDCPNCSPRKLNSTEVSQAWRQTLTLEQVENIASACTGVMELLGYRVKFDGEAGLRDPLVSAVGPLELKLN